MRQGLSSVRVLISVVGVAAIVTGGVWAARGWAWYARFEEWLVAEPVRVAIDPMAAGTYEVEFVQTCAIAHAQALFFVPGEAVADAAVFQKRMERFIVTATIARADGTPVEIYPSGGWGPGEGDSVCVERFAPVMNGDYRLTLTVDPGDGAAGMSRGELVMRNELCGLELLPGLVYKVIGVGAMVLGLVVGVGARPWRRRSPPPSPAAGEGCSSEARTG